MNDHSVQGGVACLVLDRPPVNAICAAWLDDLHRRLDALAARGDWRVLHIRSAHKTFCAGADLAEMRAPLQSPHAPPHRRARRSPPASAASAPPKIRRATATPRNSPSRAACMRARRRAGW